MKPYLKTTLRKLVQETTTELEKQKQEKNTYYRPDHKKIASLCAGLEKWVKQYPLAKGASYQKSIQEIKVKASAEASYSYRTSPTSDYGKLLARFRTLAQKVDKENRNVFIVHGRDHIIRNEVQQVLHSLGIPSIVLDKEGDAGQTIIEKFIKAAEQCEYAIIIGSPDDEGRLRSKTRKLTLDGLRPRARQNVVLELGYFLAKLGRSNIFQLYTGDIEAPSDMQGVIYQSGSNWKLKLVREMRDAGFVIDQQAADRL
ncbi:nucleotide-binding protein [Hymenobacter sp. GOD-10R]|uniref:nucleotide-binding protein n=1 Tax=Hymenobacter sp. GOD-10R TaxID=3093922 RepID=UPI002D7741DB|nr:nucleotide-binding protein [Hymenobacter sp. GOD-10R]WRQ31592.1 nucleotide-binding protein [Hymenobacter sp. GOD-10R]